MNCQTSTLKQFLASALVVAGSSCLSPAPLGSGDLQPDDAKLDAISSFSRLCEGSERPKTFGYESATRFDSAFNASFRHCFRTFQGVQMHYVIGGPRNGEQPLVLLHGWPQSWFEWKNLLPALAAKRTVIALDLPGLGDSTGSPPSFDKATLAQFVHGLVSETLGFTNIDIASHDLGSGVGFAYAAKYPSEVNRLAVMDFPLPGPGCPESQIRQLSYHFSLFNEPRVPELLITDEKVQPFLDEFFPHVSPKIEPIPLQERKEYARTYRRDTVRHNGFELYRTLARDELDNRLVAAKPLTLPILLLTQQFAFQFEAACYQPVASAVSGIQIDGAGHWLNEEAPEVVLSQFSAFFGR